jgi:uncharacterized protein (TIGR02246 family)
VDQPRKSATPDSKAEPTQSSGLQEMLRKLRAEMGLPKSPDGKPEAALDAAQRVAFQMDMASSAGAVAESQERRLCHACGNPNPRDNRFCARCGVPLEALPEGEAPAPADVKLINPLGAAAGQHHYHHHYHHHYFGSSSEEAAPGGNLDTRAPIATATAREAVKPRVPGAAGLSRAETALRKLAQDWALACNTKHLDDLVELYAPDATVLRPNVPPVRSTPAIRELFFSILEAGLGEVQMDPLRVEIFGDFAYEVGRCTMLVPTAVGKRREERGKYVLLTARQAGEWKILVDCWSTDLSLAVGSEPTAKSQTAPNPAQRSTPKTS